ncbi:MAG: DUF6034 family protein [Clostridia bacterium]
MSSYRLLEKMMGFTCCALLAWCIVITAGAEPNEYDAVHLSNDLFSIQAQYENPNGIQLSIAHTLKADYTGVIDPIHVQSLLLTSDEISRAVSSEIMFSSFNRGNKTYNARDVKVEQDGSIIAELFSYDGYFAFYGSIPSRYIRSEYSDGYGIYSPDGAANQCSITASEAKVKADTILSSLPIPFEYQWYATRAYSPTNDTYLNAGYYEIYYQQIVNQIPIAINNVLGSRDSSMQQNKYPENLYGIFVQVFDSGITKIECSWFGETSDNNQSEQPLLTFNDAMECFRTYFEAGNTFPISPMPLVISKISFEYAVCVNDDTTFSLIPCWSFLSTGAHQNFYGLRINAIDGTVILFDGCVE